MTQLSKVVSPNLVRGFKQLTLELPEFMCRYATRLVKASEVANSEQHVTSYENDPIVYQISTVIKDARSHIFVSTILQKVKQL